MNERIIQSTHNRQPAEAEVISIKTGERMNLQERYQTNYSPESTVPEVGRRAMADIINLPQLDQKLAKGTVQVVNKGAEVVDLNEYRESKERPSEIKTIYRDNGLAYAQDQPETMGYLTDAIRIIKALIEGDEALLSALPSRFQDALSVRVASYEGDISADEYEAMISVACNGLAEANGHLELPQAA